MEYLNLCHFGCGNEGLFVNKKGEWRCKESSNSCPVNKNKNREANKGFPSPMKGKNISDVTKKKISNSLKGKKKSEESKIKMRKTRKESGMYVGVLNPMYGKIHKAESIEKMKGPRDFIPFNKGKKGLQTQSPKQRERSRQYCLNGHSLYMNSLPKKLPYIPIEVKIEKLRKIRKTQEEKGKWIPKNQLKEFDLYYRMVLHYTYISINKKFTKIDLIHRGRAKEGTIQIDHIFSITEGFRQNILPCIIGSKSNLKIVNSLYNIKKKSNCDISSEELFKLYDEEIRNEYT